MRNAEEIPNLKKIIEETIVPNSYGKIRPQVIRFSFTGYVESPTLTLEDYDPKTKLWKCKGSVPPIQAEYFNQLKHLFERYLDEEEAFSLVSCLCYSDRMSSDDFLKMLKDFPDDEYEDTVFLPSLSYVPYQSADCPNNMDYELRVHDNMGDLLCCNDLITDMETGITYNVYIEEPEHSYRIFLNDIENKNSDQIWFDLECDNDDAFIVTLDKYKLTGHTILVPDPEGGPDFKSGYIRY